MTATTPTPDTICAIATASGSAAQGVIKLSGSQALSIADALFQPIQSSASTLRESQGYTAHYGWITDPTTGEHIDDVIALVMRAPRSYTGEDQVELSCHGSQLILSLVTKLLIAQGARLAEPGEFTRRAFANGKMDLSQAEAVADLIASTNRAALRMSMTQMRGLFRKRIETLRDQLIHFASLLELELDFSEEDVEFVTRAELQQHCQEILTEVTQLYQSYDTGQVIKNGIPIAIVGSTNAGKSTLLNSLLQEDRAIVSNIHGTTRDTIEEIIYIHGQEFRLIDTAGLRHTTDTIETIGIQRSLQKIATASLVLWVIDVSSDTTQADLQTTLSQLTSETSQDRIQPLLNKEDTTTSERLQELTAHLNHLGFPHVQPLTAKDHTSVEQVRNLLHDRFKHMDVAEGEVMVSNLRQATALQEAATWLAQVLQGLQSGLTSDLIAQDLRAAIRSLATVTGDITSDNILHSIFQHFCIGK